MLMKSARIPSNIPVIALAPAKTMKAVNVRITILGKREGRFICVLSDAMAPSVNGKQTRLVHQAFLPLHALVYRSRVLRAVSLCRRRSRLYSLSTCVGRRAASVRQTLADRESLIPYTRFPVVRPILRIASTR